MRHCSETKHAASMCFADNRQAVTTLLRTRNTNCGWKSLLTLLRSLTVSRALLSCFHFYVSPLNANFCTASLWTNYKHKTHINLATLVARGNSPAVEISMWRDKKSFSSRKDSQRDTPLHVYNKIPVCTTWPCIQGQRTVPRSLPSNPCTYHGNWLYTEMVFCYFYQSQYWPSSKFGSLADQNQCLAVSRRAVVESIDNLYCNYLNGFS